MTTKQLVQNSSEPKYKQIIAGIENAIRSGDLKQGDQLPSLNSIKATYNLSRDTVIMAFKDLKSRGIIHSVVGKGYYVKSEKVDVKYKILLLFDELNAFKEDLYKGFIEGLEDKAQVDIFFHHFNLEVLNSLVQEKLGAFNYYVIMPANLKGALSVISQIPKHQVYILDQLQEGMDAYAAIYQNFEYNICYGLNELGGEVLKYTKWVLIFDPDKQPQGLQGGIEKYCNEHSKTLQVVSTIDDLLIKDALYISLDDNHLIALIKQMKIQNFKLVRDLGILCYNDTPLKEIVEGGITSISTNFVEMGGRLAHMILEGDRLSVESPIEIHKRNSL